MLNTMMRFNKAILTLPMPWRIWMGLLIFANLVSPFFFLGTLEASVVLVGFAASVTLMLTLFARFGFVRLLGLGHTPWLFTVPWLAMRLSEEGVGGPFYYWLLGVVVLDGLSLVIDAVDVVRYWKGERQATVTLDA